MTLLSASLVKNKKYYFFTLILALYIVLVLFGVSNHEPWRDEAHSWVAAQDDSLGQMIESIRFSATPILGFLLLVPFARSGFPYVTMNVFHAGLAILAMGIMLFFSRIPLVLKILFMFSYYAAYEYAVIARNYVLTVFILFAIAALYARRLTKPILLAFLLFGLLQTNIYSLVPALGLGFLYSFELLKKHVKARDILAVLVMVAATVFTIITFLPDPRHANQAPPRNAMAQIPVILRHAFVPSFQNISSDSVGTFDFFVSTLTSISLICLFILLWKQKKLLILSLLTFVWLFYTNMYLHAGTLRHHGLILIYFIFFWWLSLIRRLSLEKYEKFVTRVLCLCLGLLFLVSIAFTANIYAEEYKNNFSGAEDMAMFVKAHHLDQRTIVLYLASDAEAILPYFPGKTFWYPEFGLYGRYDINDQRRQNMSGFKVGDALRKVKTNFPRDASILLLLSSPILETHSDYALLHASLSKYFWSNATENFWLYARR